MARTDVKYSILEKDGVEYEIPTEHVPLAEDIAFSDPSYTADNAKDAIKEGSSTALAAAGYLVAMATGSTAGVGKYLDFFPGTSTDILPAPSTDYAKILDVGIRTPNTSTVSVGIYKVSSGVETLVYTVSLAGESFKNYTDLDIQLNPGEDLAAKVTAGSANRPAVIVILRKGTV